VTDAQIARLPRARPVVHTADADFIRFEGLRWQNRSPAPEQHPRADIVEPPHLTLLIEILSSPSLLRTEHRFFLRTSSFFAKMLPPPARGMKAPQERVTWPGRLSASGASGYDVRQFVPQVAVRETVQGVFTQQEHFEEHGGHCATVD